MSWLSKIAKARYLGQCDRVRKCEGNEALWQAMMQKAIPITLPEFIGAVDVNDVLDEGETIEQFMESDPDAKVFISKWGDQVCWFLQMAGFEFIWVEQ